MHIIGELLMGKYVVRISFLILLSVLCSTCFAQTIIRVKTDGNDANNGSTWALAKKTVQAGIDSASASSGGEIWIAAGTYYENVTLKANCLLYGGFAGNENLRTERDSTKNKSIIDGSGNGRVILVSSTGNKNCVDGFTIRNSGIANLGIVCTNTNATVSNNIIIRNGWGITSYSSNTIITNNVIQDNFVGGIHCWQSDPSITNNSIFENGEAGIYCVNSNPDIVNNTIVGNEAGVSCGYKSPCLTNNIVAFNAIGINNNFGGTPSLKKNCVYGNTSNYFGITAGETDILQDPLLENWRYGRFHIQPGSPCIDVGASSVIDGTQLDIDGQARIQGKCVDIGADESDGRLWNINSRVIIHVSPNGRDSNDGLSWALAKKTVQAGIDAAYSNEGGEVWVAAGTYTENIILRADCSIYGGFAGTENNRSERNFNLNKSVIEGSEKKFYVINSSGITTAPFIDGFTIRGIYTGIYCNSSSNPTITNNIICGNARTQGIYCESANPTIANNIITGNSLGIDCSESNPTVRNNDIDGNDAGINCCNSSPSVINNNISGNSYGIYCWSLSNPSISNNSVYGNGNGIFCDYSNPSISNNIVVFNAIGISNNDGGSPTLKKNCIYGNTSNYSGMPAGETDMEKDPLQENWRYGKVHLQPNSPCIDAGDSSIVDGSWLDIDGQPRILGKGVDIGADESDGTLWTVNSPIVVYVSPNGNDSNDGLSWALAKKTVQAGIDTAYNNGCGEVWVAAGVYAEHITIRAACDLYGGFTGTEKNRSERNFGLNKSILNGSEEGGNVVTANGIAVTARIDGFTIRNGGGTDYGISCLSSSPTITNSIISLNGHGIMCCYSANPLIASNIIKENSGCGFYCYSSSPRIVNNTIDGNGSYGIECESSSNPFIANNIVSFNGTGIFSDSGNLALSRNCIYGNDLDYSGVTAGATEISKDPMFRDRLNGDYHLASISPCIGAGDNSAAQESWLDIDGNSRIAGGSIDIGADEYIILDNISANAKCMSGLVDVRLNNMVVSSVFDDFYYVQDTNRSWGIRIKQLAGNKPAINSVVSVKGSVSTTSDGERFLLSFDTPSVSGTGKAKSVMTVCKAVGGDDYCYDSTYQTGQRGVEKGFGLNNIGLFLTVCGTVTNIDNITKRIYINDGSADVAVYYGNISLPWYVTVGRLIRVTGACSCYKLNGNDLGRLILLKDNKSLAAVK